MTPNKGVRKYAIKDKKDKDVYLQEIIMRYPTKGFIEMHSVIEVRADLVTYQVELAWLISQIPSPYKISIDRGREILAELKIMIANDYRIPCNAISTRNPQANAIVGKGTSKSLVILSAH